MNQPLRSRDFRPRAVAATYRTTQLVEEQQTVAITALGLRAMRRGGVTGTPEACSYLDFLESAMRADGSFAFWPDHARPDWAADIPADVDDTALALLELLLAGRLERAQAVRIVARSILVQRVKPTHEIRSRWIVDGCFETWLVQARASVRPNIVDCTVNANAIALLAALEMHGCPGWSAAISTIRNALDWAGGDPVRLRSLSPFYPSIWELQSAVETAVECGCTELADLVPISSQQTGADIPVCSGAYREDGWFSPELHALRSRYEDAIP